MANISLANPAIYQNDVDNPTDGEALLADLQTIVGEVNAKETRITNLESNAMNIDGVKTFLDPIKVDIIQERTGDAGVLIDGVLLKDGFIPGMIPVGGVVEWPHDVLPTQGIWLWANGAAHSRTTYAALYALWGTRYGSGDGLTTFNVFDKRNVTSVGTGTMGGTANRGLITSASTGGANANTLGSVLGAETHALVEAENGPHSHTYQRMEDVATSQSGSNRFTPNGYSTQTTSVSGAGAPHNNMQPTVVSNFIIRAA